jgi:hypothetical protein
MFRRLIVDDGFLNKTTQNCVLELCDLSEFSVENDILRRVRLPNLYMSGLSDGSLGSDSRGTMIMFSVQPRLFDRLHLTKL